METGRAKPKYFGENPSTIYFIYHKTHMGCPGNELGPPCSEALVSAK
jgi:hypothetical protein